MVVTLNRTNLVVLHNIGWQQFENLLLDLEDSGESRFAYNGGILEVITSLPEHEYYKEVISAIIQDMA